MKSLLSAIKQIWPRQEAYWIKTINKQLLWGFSLWCKKNNNDIKRAVFQLENSWSHQKLYIFSNLGLSLKHTNTYQVLIVQTTQLPQCDWSIFILMLKASYRVFTTCARIGLPSEFIAGSCVRGFASSPVSLEAYWRTLFALLIKFSLCIKWGHIPPIGVTSLSCTTKGMHRNLCWNNHCLSVDLYFLRLAATVKFDATACGFYCFNFTDSWD